MAPLLVDTSIRPYHSVAVTRHIISCVCGPKEDPADRIGQSSDMAFTVIVIGLTLFNIGAGQEAPPSTFCLYWITTNETICGLGGVHLPWPFSPELGLASGLLSGGSLQNCQK